jgi:hypothetical protein
MAGYLAMLSYFSPPLDLDKSADLRAVADRTSIKVDQFRLENAYVIP